MLYFPLGGYFFSLTVLAFIASSKKNEGKMLLFFVCACFVVIAIIINENSVQKFVIREDDFTTYYNNYLSFLNNDYSAFFEFGGGFEVGLPFLNYILSTLIDEPLPYLVQVFYIIIFIGLFYYYVVIDKYFISSKRPNRYILFVWGLAFLKITAMLTIERQAIASFFVLFAISDRRKKLLWLLLGCLFHLSTPVVYFFIKNILDTKTYQRAFLYCLGLFITVAFSYEILTVINNILPNDKIGFVLYFFNNKDLVHNEIIKSIKQIAYILPLLCFNFILRLKTIKWSLGPSLMFFSLSMLILSVLPGVPTRLMMPIIFILFGFYYYHFFNQFSNLNQLAIYAIITLCLSSYKFFLPGYYQRYPLLGSYPGYYVDAFVEKHSYTRRPLLPSMADVDIGNEDKL
jgi:hypothetical protein